MQRIQAPSNVSVMPDPRAFEQDPGYFSAGDPANGVMPTMVTAEWLNGVQEEIVSAIEDAGITPDSSDVNQMASALRIIAQDAVLAVVHEITEGGIESWASTVDYVAGDVVRGSDASIYVAKNASGPSSTVVDPVSDSTGKWGKIALDADVVKLTGAQTISGNKTFTAGGIRCTGNQCCILMAESDVDAYTNNTSGSYSALEYADKNEVVLATLSYQLGTGNNPTMAEYLTIRPPDTTGKTTGYFSVEILGVNGDFAYFMPRSSNGVINLGGNSNRWNTVYAATGTIQTSDERLKSAIEPVPDAVLDAWGEINWLQFRMKDAIEQKGVNARIHNGIIAQRVNDAFNAHGLDASRYGLFCYDEWDAEDADYDEKGLLIKPEQKAGNQYSIRYDEALCMEAAYQRRRADRAEARISALEQRLNEMETVLASLMSPVGDETYAEYAEPEQEQDAEQEGGDEIPA